MIEVLNLQPRYWMTGGSSRLLARLAEKYGFVDSGITLAFVETRTITSSTRSS